MVKRGGYLPVFGAANPAPTSSSRLSARQPRPLSSRGSPTRWSTTIS